MVKAGLVFGIRSRIFKMIVMIAEIFAAHPVRELAVRQRITFQAGVHTRLVEGQRIKRCEHADIRQDRRIVLRMAVAVRRHIYYKRNMEIRTSVDHRLGIFRHTAVQFFGRRVIDKFDSVKGTGSQTSAAPYAVVGVDRHLLCIFMKFQTVVRAFLLAAAASAADIRINVRFPVGMLVFLARAGSASHADILDGSAETGHLMSLEMRQADENVGVHDGPSDPGVLYVLAAVYRYLNIVGPLQSVADDDRTSHRKRGKPILPGTLQMLQRIFPAARIECIAVGQERHAAQFLYHIGDCLCVIGAQKTEVAQFSEVHLDRHELLVHIKLLDACLFNQSFQFCGQSLAQFGSEICVIYF